ncbi:threonine transporter RhtB [Rhizobium sp. FKY42]|uniref:LysE family translocator n=1 Tax=Rhizobium sp. FKY42 TaxID=2562310 RepID=UPI0010BFA52B|nr:threonine transporter RhtB [Rhizobium sp. FKY42]
MTLVEFTFAILLLLCTPGPTNTLMALGGYERGVVKAMPLIGAELAGYLTVILPVATLAAPVFDEWPMLSLWMKLVAGLWVFVMAIRLWSIPAPTRGHPRVTGRSVYLTTCLNPKALIIGLVIMPHGSLLALMPRTALFAVLILMAASGWIVIGATLKKKGARLFSPAFISRAASIGMFTFALLLTGTSLGALI